MAQGPAPIYGRRFVLLAGRLVLSSWGGDDHVHGHAHGAPPSGGEHAEHQSSFATVATTPLRALLATGIHTLGYLVVMGLVAVIVYEKVGLAILRKAWFNLDLIWAGALIVTGVLILVL